MDPAIAAGSPRITLSAHPDREPAHTRGIGVMPAQPRNMPEQEHSIKVRSHELYVEPESRVQPKKTRPFPVYLRETPARPLSPLTKAIIATAGTIVAVLFLLALWRVAHRQGSPSASPVSAGRSALRSPLGRPSRQLTATTACAGPSQAGRRSIVASGQRDVASLS